MATNTTVAYQARVQIDGGNLNSLANGNANALSAVDNHAAGYDGYHVHYSLTCASAPTAGGTITLYMIAATDTGGGTAGTYTDSIAPGGTGVTVINAAPIRTLAVNTTTPFTISGTFELPVATPPPFWTLVVKNGSGVALAASGCTLFVQPYQFASQ